MYTNKPKNKPVLQAPWIRKSYTVRPEIILKFLNDILENYLSCFTNLLNKNF
jgi:hypothetical protein